MKVVNPGHIYMLEHLDGSESHNINFVNRNPGQQAEGTTNQEVLRALLDRVKFLDNQLPWCGNKEIIKHLEMALVLHEARAIIRKVEKDTISIDDLEINPKDGHFCLKFKQ